MLQKSNMSWNKCRHYSEEAKRKRNNYLECECGCGAAVIKRKNRFICGHSGNNPPKRYAPWNMDALLECECGCGNFVSKPGNRFIHGHSRKGRFQKGNISWNWQIGILPKLYCIS